jgi:hypothetical protein
VCPLRLPPGTVTVPDTVVIDDTFGDSHQAIRAGNDDPAWNLFSLTGGTAQSAARALYLPPVLPEGLESGPVEVVRLLRDEAANLAWAVEARVERGGEPVDRRSAWFAARARRPADAAPDGRHYAVQTDVPDYWIPLVPRRLAGPAAGNGNIRLVVGMLARPAPRRHAGDRGTREPPPARGRGGGAGVALRRGSAPRGRDYHPPPPAEPLARRRPPAVDGTAQDDRFRRGIERSAP